MHSRAETQPSCPNSFALADARDWEHAVEAAQPATLLLIIESRLAHSLSATPEDILQETLLRAWRSRATFVWHGHRAFRAWLLTIADRCIADLTDYARAACRDRARNQPWDESAPPDAVSSTTTPSRIAAYREQCAAIRRALDALPEHLRVPLRLRVIEQLPLAQVASLTGLSVAAVQHRVRRGAVLYQALLRQSWTAAPESAPAPAPDPASKL